MDTMFSLKDGEIVVHPSMLANKYFKDLIRRDRGGMMEGDSQGVKKFRAMAEIGLIWYCINLNSPGIQQGYEGDELEQHGKKFFGLPDDWKKDNAFAMAYDHYKEFYNGSIVIQAIRNTIEGLAQTNEITGQINKTIKGKIRTEQLSPEDIAEVVKLNKELMNVASTLPDVVKNLKNLELSYLKEELLGKKARGGHRITSSMQ